MLEKICPKCNKEYSNLFFVCLDDYTTLEDKKLILLRRMTLILRQGLLENPLHLVDKKTFSPSQTNSSITSSHNNTYSYTKQTFPFIPEEFVGKTLDGKYKIDDLIRKEGLANTYRVTDVTNKQLMLIIKVMDFAPFRECYDESSLMYKAKQLANINHTNVLPLLDFGAFSNNFYYLIYKIVGEINFQDSIKIGLQLDIIQSLRLAKGVCLALEQLYQMSVFEPLTPENILLSNLESETKIQVQVQIDFSIINKLSCLDIKHPSILDNDLFYIAPEIVEKLSEQPKTKIEIDPQASIYNIGCFLYHMLTGRPPFTASTNTALLLKHVHALPRPLKELDETIPDELNDFIWRKLLAKRPSDRIQGFRQLHKELSCHEENAILDKKSLQQVKTPLLTDEPFLPEDEPFPPHLIKIKDIPSQKVRLRDFLELFRVLFKRLRKYRGSLYQGKGLPTYWNSPTGWQPELTNSGFLLTPTDKNSTPNKILVYKANYNLTDFSLKLKLYIGSHSTFNIVFGGGFSTPEFQQNNNCFVVSLNNAHGAYQPYHITISDQKKKYSFSVCFVPHNEWIEMRVTIRKSTISVYLNNVLTNQIKNAPLTPGQIGIFSAYGDVHVNHIFTIHCI